MSVSGEATPLAIGTRHIVAYFPELVVCNFQVKVQAFQLPVKAPTDQAATNGKVANASHFTTDVVEREKK